MRQNSLSAAFLFFVTMVTTTEAQSPDVERVYFVPAQFVRMVSQNEGRVESNKAFARVGEVRAGSIGREWSIQIPNGQMIQVQDQINDKGKTWLRVVPESLISARFAAQSRSSRTSTRPPRRLSSRFGSNRSRDTNSRTVPSWIGGLRRRTQSATPDVALAAHTQPILSIPPMSDRPVTAGMPVAEMPVGEFPVDAIPMGADGSFVMPPAPSGYAPSGYSPNGQYPGNAIPGPYGPPKPANCNTPPRSRAATVVIPPMIGGFYDNSNLNVQLTTQNEFNVFGQPTNGPILFERDGAGVFNDLVSIPGTGSDASGDNIDDTFEISEPLPPNDVPTAPSPSATYTGGTVTYTGGVGTAAIDGQFGNNSIWRATYGFAESLQMVAPGGVQRITVADNNSPVPRDRIHFNYRHYHNATVGFGNIHRYTFGVEKAFLNDWFSIDARLPFAAAWDSVTFEGDPAMASTDFGDISLFAKTRILELQTVLVSGGVGVSLPSGPDSRLFRSDGTQVAWIKNESFHLLPFVGTIWAPNNYFYLQSFLQVDVDLHGNTVSGSSAGGRLPTIGKLSDTTTLTTNLSGGYWILRDRGPQFLMQGLAAIIELNYTTTLDDADSVAANGIRITEAANELDVFDISTGLHAQLGRSLALTSAITFPLGSGLSKRSDWEISGMVSWLF